jgi:hypothetical protein
MEMIVEYERLLHCIEKNTKIIKKNNENERA